MSFTYNARLADNIVDRVRFKIQDTGKDGAHLIENEEIEFVLTEYDNNVNAACAALCEVMASRWAKKQEVISSNYRQNMDTVYSKLMKRADRFRLNATSTAHFRVPSLSISTKESYEDDTDIPEPSFKRKLFDNPFAASVDEKSNLT